ncbi:MAG: Wzt carbohydrate-binding domain-containing protein, partial [Actinomycetes bacterium]
AELTGRENVYLNGALLGFSKAEVDEMYDDIVAFAELEEYMDQKLKNYSSGMQVRIAFAVSTRARADVLLVDEVLAVGDTAFQRKCFEHFHALKQRHTTIVFVTHNMAAVREFCDRAILIEDTRIVAEGPAEDIATRYERLFSHTAPQAKSPDPGLPEETRWGEGQVRYQRVEVAEVLDDHDELIIDLEAVAERDVDEAVYSFLIRDSRGTMVLGTNSLLKKQDCGGLAKDERVSIRWSVPNVFSDGPHSVELGIADRQGLTVYDSWKEAATFMVIKDEKTPYVVTPDTSLTLIRLPG